MSSKAKHNVDGSPSAGTVENHKTWKPCFSVFSVFLQLPCFAGFFAPFVLFRSFCSLDHRLNLILPFTAFRPTYYF